MFFTARQLEALHRDGGGNGTLVLPYRARLTPAAQDWVRSKKIALGYSGDASATPLRGRPDGAAPAPSGAAEQKLEAPATGTTLWWCDGPCGAVKAAITTQAKESALRALDIPADAKQIVPVVRAVAKELKAGTADAAVLVVQNAAAAMVFANRCRSVRAVVGTCLDAVEQGLRLVAANVLVIEHPYKTLPQAKSLLARFCRAKRELTPDVQRQLEELSTCG
ncbi:MAG TPA: RpiB/LacA/LacB family sugar-phosphate isomerase [Humisphaera sp.]